MLGKPFVKLVLGAALMAAACAPARHIGPPEGRSLIWADEFNGAQIDTRCWRRTVEATPWDREYQHAYVDDPRNVFLRDGFLHILGYREDVVIEGVSRAYSSGMISTDTLAFWRYGYFEARIRTPAQQGAFPAFWMMPQHEDYGHWPSSGEIDIFEFIAREPNTVFTTIHFEGANGEPDRRGQGTRVAHDLSEDFHVYGLEWRPGVMRWYFDNRLVYETRDWRRQRGARHAPFDQPFFLIFNLSIGGGWAQAPDPNEPSPMHLAVDYVRVYALPGLEQPPPRPVYNAPPSTCPAGGPG